MHLHETMTLSEVRDAAYSCGLDGLTLRQTIQTFTNDGYTLSDADRRAILVGYEEGQHERNQGANQ